MFALQMKTGTYLFYDKFDVTRKGGNCDGKKETKGRMKGRRLLVSGQLCD